MRILRPASLSPEAGIALGPILFMLAILAMLAAVISAGSGGFNTATVADRVTADIVSQTNLIRTKIYECNLMYGSNPGNYDGYPQDSTTGSPGVLVSGLNCSGDPSGLQSLWSGNRVTNFPPPTAGFNQWFYASNSTGFGFNPTFPAAVNRCIYTTPIKSSGGIVQGLTNAGKKFTTVTANDGISEVNYNPASTNQRFVVWIGTPPASGATIIAACNPNT